MRQMKRRGRPSSTALAFGLAAFLLFILWERHEVQSRVETLRENATFVSLGEKRRIRVRKSGMENRGIPIIFEAGLGETSTQWSLLQADLARDHPVLSYDRRGTGLSDEASEGMGGLARVRDLEDLLAKSDLTPPYLFVSHGYGAALVRLFQHQHPGKVAAIVMIEPILSEADIEGAGEDGEAAVRRQAHLASFGLSRFSRGGKGQSTFPAQEASEMNALGKYDRHLLGIATEREGVKEELKRLAGLPRLENLPLGVVSATAPQNRETAKALARHDEIARQSRRGVHVMIDGAKRDTILTHPAFVSQTAADIRNLEALIPPTTAAVVP